MYNCLIKDANVCTPVNNIFYQNKYNKGYQNFIFALKLP